MEPGKLIVMEDPIADALDDLAALGQHWTRNRERGRMPNGIRLAMLMVAREVLAHADMQERETQRRISELCGPEAYARNNGGERLTPNAEVTGAGAQRREPKAVRFWRPVDRLVKGRLPVVLVWHPVLNAHSRYCVPA